MKRIIIMLSIVVIFLCACSKSSTDMEYFGSEPEINHRNNGDKANEQISPISYETTDELMKGISNEFGCEEEDLENIERTESKKKRGTFKRFIADRKKKKRLHIPQYNGIPIKMRNEKGFHNIVILPSELYGQTWIWFYPQHKDLGIIVKTSYLENDIVDEANQKGCSWVVNQLAPSAPNIDNYKEYPGYTEIYEKNIALRDRTVNAMIYKIRNETKSQIAFVYDDILVYIVTSSEQLPLKWLANLSFESTFK